MRPDWVDRAWSGHVEMHSDVRTKCSGTTTYSLPKYYHVSMVPPLSMEPRCARAI